MRISFADAISLLGQCLVSFPVGAIALAIVALSGGLSGCTNVANSTVSGFADNLSTAILNQDDPDLVREGAPAYLLLLDGLVQGSPDDPDLLGAAAELYAVYGTLFVDDASRAEVLTARARQYGGHALCAADRDACRLQRIPFDEYDSIIQKVRPGAADALFSYAVGSLAYIRAHSGDMTALADLPKVESVLNRLREISPEDQLGRVYLYLGVLNSLRPPALGGQPERGREYFQRALELTDAKDLSVKVEYARGYARLVYDRELHDQLLVEVLAADVNQPNMTLFNSIAQQQAAELLATADEYF
jgi:hypothetical protein